MEQLWRERECVSPRRSLTSPSHRAQVETTHPVQQASLLPPLRVHCGILRRVGAPQTLCLALSSRLRRLRRLVPRLLGLLAEFLNLLPLHRALCSVLEHGRDHSLPRLLHCVLAFLGGGGHLVLQQRVLCGGGGGGG